MNSKYNETDFSVVEIVNILWRKLAYNKTMRKCFFMLIVALVLMRASRKRKNIKQKLVLVTGAATGIGREQAFKFAEAGSRLALCDINDEMLEKTVNDVRMTFGGSIEVEGYVCNLSESENVYSMADEIRARQGHVEILINNAGIISGQELLSTPESRIELSMKVNAMAYFWTAKAFLPNMIKNNYGHIVGICSAAGLFPSPRMVDYCTSKFAARGFMEALHTELLFIGSTGVKTSTLFPAHVNTDLFKGYKFGIGMSPKYVAQQVVDAVQFERSHVYLPFTVRLGEISSLLYPTWIWDAMLSITYSSMRDWKSDQAEKIFGRMEDVEK